MSSNQEVTNYLITHHLTRPTPKRTKNPINIYTKREKNSPPTTHHLLKATLSLDHRLPGPLHSAPARPTTDPAPRRRPRCRSARRSQGPGGRVGSSTPAVAHFGKRGKAEKMQKQVQRWYHRYLCSSLMIESPAGRLCVSTGHRHKQLVVRCKYRRPVWSFATGNRWV